MTTLVTVKFQKPGAEFSSAEAASSNRVVGASLEFMQKITKMNSDFLISGVLAAPNTRDWDADTCTLTIEKRINDMDAYDAGWAEIADEMRARTLENGWHLVSKETTEE